MSPQPVQGMTWTVLVVLVGDYSKHHIQLLQRQWPDASLWRLPQRAIEPQELLQQARGAAADYVLLLADSLCLDPALLSNLCRLVALNPGFDVWISGERLGLWSWDFSNFSYDSTAMLLMRTSLLEQHAQASRNRRNSTRILPVLSRDLLLSRYKGPCRKLQHSLSSSDLFVDNQTLNNMMRLLPLARSRIHPLPPEPKLVAVIPTRDRADLLADAVAGLTQQHLPLPLELVIVDNGSEEEATRNLLESLASGPLPFIIVRDEMAFNFSALCNRGIEASQASMILLLNNDVVFSNSSSLAAMVELAKLEIAGCVGALLRYPDGQIQHLGVELSGELVRHQGHGHSVQAGDLLLQYPRQVAAVTAACMLFRRSLWDELAGFDEELPVDFNDVDFCLRAQEAGFANLITPAAVALHLESASRGLAPHASFSDSLRSMKSRWGKHIGNDPYSIEI